MTHEEVYQELEREREAVTTWWQYQLAGERRRALKCRQFPMHIWREYTSQRKNRYLFYSRVFDKKMRTILTGIAVVRHTSDGLTVYTTWLADQRLISPMIMMPHMWRRYAERTGDKKAKGWGSYSKTNAEEFFAEGIAKSLTGKSDYYTKALKKLTW